MAIRSRMEAMMDPRVHAPTSPSSSSKGVRLLHVNGSSIAREERIYTFGKPYARGGAVFPGKGVRVLKIEGKCSYVRAKAAHISGHLP
jgi:hypothetical protein